MKKEKSKRKQFIKSLDKLSELCLHFEYDERFCKECPFHKKRDYEYCVALKHLCNVYQDWCVQEENRKRKKEYDND
jgi:hypothetical protein